MKPTYRFYAFVAGLYLSPLQRGLQTGHAISEMHSDLLMCDANDHAHDRVPSAERDVFDDWAQDDKTIVILDALNSEGVVMAYNKATEFADFFHLPITIFSEDIASLNGAPTAAGIIVPDYIFAAKQHVSKPSFIKSLFGAKPTKSYRYDQKCDDGAAKTFDYAKGMEAHEFCAFLKSYKLAQS